MNLTERLVQSPRLIFNFKPNIIYNNYIISELYYKKLLFTLDYIEKSYYKKLESKYLDEEQMIEIHRWLGNNSYVEYRNFESESSTDIVTLDLFENPEDSYQHLMIFQTKEPEESIYNRLIIGNDYFNNGYVLTEDFEWNIYDECGMIDIKKDDINMDDISELRFDKPHDYSIKNVLEGFKELILLD
jgi:hypothetical protein